MVKEGVLMVLTAWWGRHPPWLLMSIGEEGGVCHCIGTGGDVAGMRGRGNKVACGMHTALYCLWGCGRHKQGSVWDAHCPVTVLPSPSCLNEAAGRLDDASKACGMHSASHWCLCLYMHSSLLPSALCPPSLLLDSACWLWLQVSCDVAVDVVVWHCAWCGGHQEVGAWWSTIDDVVAGGAGLRGELQVEQWKRGKWNRLCRLISPCTLQVSPTLGFPSCCLSADCSRIQTLAHSLGIIYEVNMVVCPVYELLSPPLICIEFSMGCGSFGLRELEGGWYISVHLLRGKLLLHEITMWKSIATGPSYMPNWNASNFPICNSHENKVYTIFMLSLNELKSIKLLPVTWTCWHMFLSPFTSLWKMGL